MLQNNTRQFCSNMPTIFHLIINPKALEYYQDILQYVQSLKNFQYLLVVEHLGQEEKHYHMLLQLSKSLPKLSTKKTHGAHIQPKLYGSTQAMIDYLWCRDEKHKEEGVTAVLIDEIGEYKKQGGYSVKALKEVSDEDELTDYRMYNIWKKLKHNKKRKVSEYRKSVKVYWIQGPSGIGKTNKAMDIAEEFEERNDWFTDFVKFENGFYLGVSDGSKIAIYDDFRDSHMKPSEFINFIDYNRHWLNVKGGSLLNEYNLIIITSVQRLDRIYRRMADDEPKKQWERRIEVIDMYPPEQVCLGGLPLGYRTDFNQLEEVEVTDDWDSTRVVIN